ncbi:hypothetical protein MMC07_002319 [Pseudocyphellaria aurata]|nr:hypothetical protein [Pseudocyphellaria aurata]
MATQNALDPDQIFNIINIRSDGLCACHGVTAKNCSCGQRIKRAEVRQVLDLLAVMDPSSPAVANMLMTKIIPLFLCDRWHRQKWDQRLKLFSDWSDKIILFLKQQWKEMSKRDLRQALEKVYREYYAAQPVHSRHRMRLEKSRQEHEKTQQELERVQQDFERVQQDFDKAQRKAEESHTRSVDLASEVTDLQSELQEARRQLEENQLAFQTLQASTSSQIEKVQQESHARSASTSSQIEKVQQESHARSVALESEVTGLQSELQKAQRQLEKKDKNHQSSAVARNFLLAHLKRTRNTLAETQRQLQERNIALKDHESSAAAKISSLEQDLKSTNDTLEESRRQWKESKDSFEEHRSSDSIKIIELSTALDRAKEQASTSADAVSSLRAQLQEAERKTVTHKLKRTFVAAKRHLDAFKQRSIRLVKSIFYPPRTKHQDTDSG